MANFIKIADENDTCDFLNLDQVGKVTFEVRRSKSGGGFNLMSVTDPSLPKSIPAIEREMAVITLITPAGNGELRFDKFFEAENWARDNLGITVSFDQL